MSYFFLIKSLLLIIIITIIIRYLTIVPTNCLSANTVDYDSGLTLYLLEAHNQVRNHNTMVHTPYKGILEPDIILFFIKRLSSLWRFEMYCQGPHLGPLNLSFILEGFSIVSSVVHLESSTVILIIIMI